MSASSYKLEQLMRLRVAVLGWVVVSVPVSFSAVAQTQLHPVQTITPGAETGKIDAVYSVALSPDGQVVTAAVADKTLRIWEVSTGELVATRKLPENGMGVAFSPDGSAVAVTTKRLYSNGAVVLFDVANGWSYGQVLAYKTQPENIDALGTGLIRFSPDARFLASQLSGWGPVTVWNLKAGSAHTLEHPDEAKRKFSGAADFSFSRDGALFVSWSRYGIEKWNTKSLKQDAGWKGVSGNTLACSSDGRWVALSHGGVITVLSRSDLEESSQKRGFDLKGHVGRVKALEFSTDSKRLASAESASLESGKSDNVIRIWNVDRRNCERILSGHRSAVMSVSLASDGTFLASASLDKTVRIWSLDDRKISGSTLGRTALERGTAAYKKGYDLRAIRELTKAISELTGPQKNAALRFRGQSLARMGDHPKAASDYSAAIELNANDVDAMINRGYSYSKMRSYELAIKDYERVCVLKPDDARGWNGAAWLWATCSDPKFRNGKKAVEYAQKACKLTDNEVWYMDTLSAAYAESGEYPRAALLQAAVVGKAPENWSKEAYDRLELYRRRQPYREP